MLYYNRINLSGAIDVDKASVPKECIIYHYWYFLDKGFKFQPSARNDCHDVLMMSINHDSVTILNINDIYYCSVISELANIKPQFY